MSRRRFFYPAERSTSNTGISQLNWAECYAVSRLRSSWSSIDTDCSGRNSPDQSNPVDPDPPQSSSSSSHDTSQSSSSCSSAQASPAHNPTCSPTLTTPTETRRILIFSSAQATPRSSPAPSQIHSCSPVVSERGSYQRRPRAHRRRTLAQVCLRRTHHGRRLWGHLPVAIPSDRWYTGVGSLRCAQCQSQRSFNRTSWMCLECRVPLCLLTWRNCYSQWHSGE